MRPPAHVQEDIEAILSDLRGRKQVGDVGALRVLIQERLDELEEEPESWPEVITNILNHQELVRPAICSAVLRGRAWRSPGSAWSKFTSAPGTIAKCLENAGVNVAKKAANGFNLTGTDTIVFVLNYSLWSNEYF